MWLFSDGPFKDLFWFAQSLVPVAIFSGWWGIFVVSLGCMMHVSPCFTQKQVMQKKHHKSFIHIVPTGFFGSCWSKVHETSDGYVVSCILSFNESGMMNELWGPYWSYFEASESPSPATTWRLKRFFLKQLEPEFLNRPEVNEPIGEGKSLRKQLPAILFFF